MDQIRLPNGKKLVGAWVNGNKYSTIPRTPENDPTYRTNPDFIKRVTSLDYQEGWLTVVWPDGHHSYFPQRSIEMLETD